MRLPFVAQTLAGHGAVEYNHHRLHHLNLLCSTIQTHKYIFRSPDPRSGKNDKLLKEIVSHPL
jgi:hypothetical protein